MATAKIKCFAQAGGVGVEARQRLAGLTKKIIELKDIAVTLTQVLSDCQQAS
ncbi:MAG: hypothetical protein JSR33_00045 [Proteobacteria bacterium]|nr:hypothetical protein [Pseudomonadota bacterium]